MIIVPARLPQRDGTRTIGLTDRPVLSLARSRVPRYGELRYGPMALTETDLQVVVEHVKSMLPAMLIETAPSYADTQKLISRIEENLIRVEEHLARSEERTAQEFKALRELMQAGFAAVDERFEAVDKRFEDMHKAVNKRFADMTAAVDNASP